MTVRGRANLIALYSGYGDNIKLHSGDALVVHPSRDVRVVVIEYEVHGQILKNGNSYDNMFIAVVTIEDRKIVHWRDYMDSLAAWTGVECLWIESVGSGQGSRSCAGSSSMPCMKVPEATGPEAR